MNEVHLIGNLTRDPETKSVGANGTSLAKFGIAVNGTKKGEVSFIDVEAWEKTADFIGQYFKKGKPIIVHGSLKQESWDDKATGQKRSKLLIRANRVEFVPGGKKDKDPDAAAADDVPAAAGGDFASGDAPGGDIPF